MAINLPFSVGALPQLAPDSNFIQDALFSDSTAPRRTTATIDPSSGLTPILSLVGKFEVSMLQLLNITGSDTTTVKMTVDGVDIWNSSKVFNNSNPGLLGMVGDITVNGALNESFVCNTSLLIEIQTTTDTSVSLAHRTRPIL